MNIKEYVKIQSKKCKNKVMKQIFKDLVYTLTYSYEPKTSYSYPVASTPKKVDDSTVKNKRIYILPEFNKQDKTVSTKSMKCGYISTISDDIVEDNGDIYEIKGSYQSYKFYKFDNEYYVRMEGSNVLSKINELNYNRFKDMIDYIELN
jgi:hypothetical protein